MSRAIAILGVVVLTVLLAGLSAEARREKVEREAPDLTGVWKGTSQSVALGKLGHDEPAHAPKFLKVDFTLTVEKQEGANFYGVRASAKGKEVLLGVVAGTKVSMVDDDGILTGRLVSKNKMILTYLEPGKDSKVASIAEFVREGKDDQPEKPAAAGQ